MRRTRLAILSLLVFCGCDGAAPPEEAPREPSKAEKRAEGPVGDETRPRNASGRIYLPIYSHIYTRSGNADDLATTISVRNVSTEHSIELEHVNYYDTKGQLIEDLVGEPVVLEPLETVEYFLASLDKRGGSGANAVVEWHASTSVARPLVEAVMVRTSGSQAYAFTTRGVDIRTARPEAPSAVEPTTAGPPDPEPDAEPEPELDPTDGSASESPSDESNDTGDGTDGQLP